MNPIEATTIMRGQDGTLVPLIEVDVRAHASGLVLDTSFRQRYRNDGSTNIEAVYTFPLPQGAVLLALAFTLGERRLVGVVCERRAAERQYEDAIDQGHSAVLLEKTGEGLYTVSVGNLMAGEEAVVEVRYAQLLSFVQGAVRIAIPTVVAPRYGSALAAGIPHHAVPETDLAADYPVRLTIELTGELAAGTIECPTHPAELHRHAGVATLVVEGALDRDFVVTVGGLQARPLASLARDGDGWVALASFLPPAPAAPEPAAGLRVKLMVDCSGSMAGDSIAQARRAAARLLDQLGDLDQVDLSRFGSSVEHFYVMERATRAHLARCHRWARELQANLGGTEMLAALREVFERAGQPGSDDGADVFLITDGEVHEADDIIALARRHRQRVFVVGVGSAPNESLLQRLAAETGGAAELVTPNESIEDALMRLFARLRQPRATGLAVDWPATSDWSAPLPPALWAGETAHALARFAAPPAGEARLRWLEGGTQRSVAVPLPGADPCAVRGNVDAAALPSATASEAQRGDALPRLAAGLAVNSLPEEERGAFAERYQLVTDRTSMVLVLQRDADARADELPVHLKVKQMLAAGWGGSGSVRAFEVASAPMLFSHCMAFDDQYDRMDEAAASVYRHPSSSRMREALESPCPATLEELATQAGNALRSEAADASDAGDERALGLLRLLLPPELERALDAAMLQAGPEGLDESALLAWLVVELARRFPQAAFPRAALRRFRARARGVAPPQGVVDALDALDALGPSSAASGALGRSDLPPFLRHSPPDRGDDGDPGYGLVARDSG